VSQNDFYMIMKSTLDKHCNELIASSGADAGANLDDIQEAVELFHTDQNAILWQLINADEQPRDPLYHVVFAIGGRTTNDSGNYNLISLQTAVNAVFHKGKEIELYDYSGPIQSVLKGCLTITQAGLTPQESDNESGLRMQIFTGRAFRFG
jgi:hypothetical protein